MGIRRGS
ncbi:hypothetical protein YPPY56_4105, partial [Yersinia pestis PY-56]